MPKLGLKMLFVFFKKIYKLFSYSFPSYILEFLFDFVLIIHVG